MRRWLAEWALPTGVGLAIAGLVIALGPRGGWLLLGLQGAFLAALAWVATGHLSLARRGGVAAALFGFATLWPPALEAVVRGGLPSGPAADLVRLWVVSPAVVGSALAAWGFANSAPRQVGAEPPGRQDRQEARRCQERLPHRQSNVDRNWCQRWVSALVGFGLALVVPIPWRSGREGLALGVVGCASIAVAMVLARNRRAPERVEVDARGVQRIRPDGGCEALTWDELVAVSIVTTDEGPASEDLWWMLRSRSGGVAVPGGLAGELVERLVRLPGFDLLEMTRACGSTRVARFECWTRPPDDPNGWLEAVRSG